ncbi:MAG TPA: hypothetical protein VHX61_20715 [Rhizomicrobium sp.]|jgi:hypothetical protein|nr:hypothetical protein [Rhizomicrobium sp.]
MSSLETTDTQRALAREWLAARIIVIGGFAAALVAGLWFGVVYPDFIRPREQHALLVQRVEKVLHDEAQVCTTALATAKNFGIVPQYGQLMNARLSPTDVPGRYVCLAATSAAKYILAVDLLCRDYGNVRCASLYNVSQSDGTVLYQRQR